jgi:uncharacterized OB-fold protein
VVRHATHPAVVDAVPYVAALVDLEAGPTVLMNVVGCAVDDVRVGLAVEIVLAPTPGGLELAQARPLAGGADAAEPGA